MSLVLSRFVFPCLFSTHASTKLRYLLYYRIALSNDYSLMNKVKKKKKNVYTRSDERKGGK